MLRINSTQSVTGLDTWEFDATAASPLFVFASVTDVPPSGVAITINLNGSPVGVSPSVATSKQAVSAHAQMTVAPGDVVTVVVSASGSLMNDSILNTIRTMIRLDQVQNG